MRFLICSLVAVTLTGCTRFTALNGLVTTHGYARTSDVAYGPLPRQKLDVYKPAHPNGGLVVFFYGGSWNSGEKADYRFAAQALTKKGFIAVLPDYRLYPEATFPAFVEDGAKAVSWAHDHAAELGATPGRLYLMGHSAGAHIVALLTLDAHYLNAVGLDRSAVRATVALSGPYDFQPGPDTYPSFNMTSPNDKPDPKIEPITFADGKAPPMMLVHGLRDTTVSPNNAVELFAKIRAAGGDVHYYAYPTLGHVGVVLSLAAPFRWLAPVLDDAAAYMDARR